MNIKRPILFLIYSTIFLTTSSALAASVEERLTALEVTSSDESSATLNDVISFGVLVEVEAAYEKEEATDATSGLEVAAVELSTEIEANDNISGYVVFLYEEGGSATVDLDQAAMVLSNSFIENNTMMLTAGRAYLPFGVFNSGMVSDPVTLELGETSATTLLATSEGDLYSIHAGLFKGAVDDGTENHIDSWVAAINLTPYEDLSFDAAWLSDLAESGAEFIETPVDHTRPVPAAVFSVSWQLDAFSLNAEYMTALKDFAPAVVGLADNDLTGAKPAAWFAEVGYAVSEDVGVAVRYEGTSDYQDEVKRYGAAVSHGFYEYASFSLEYLYSDFPDEVAGDTHIATAQLGLEF